MLFTDARLADGRHVDIAVGSAGTITEMRPSTGRLADGPAGEHVDLGGRLLLPALAEPHAHLDKALTAEAVPNPTGDLIGAITAWSTAADAGVFTHDDMVIRIGGALDRLLLNGVTAVRTHVNCGSSTMLRHISAAREAAAAYDDLLRVELVALPHFPIAGESGADNRSALRAAVEAGADIVGGCPHLEVDGGGCISVALDLADEFDLPVDLHVDETLDASILTLRQLAATVADRGWSGRVTASHCVSLGVQPPDVQAAIAAEVADAGISVIALPQTNLFLQGREHQTAMPRGLTAVHALREAGVVVAGGGDNVQDPFNLVGRSDPLETAALLVMAAHVMPDDAYEMVSNDARCAMGLAPVRFDIGDPADFLAIDAVSVRQAIADAPADRMTIRAGRVVAETTTTRRIAARDR